MGLADILKKFPGQRVLVMGDVILDWYWWGQASRLSPEAPVPVVRKQRTTLQPGGAGNTAANLAALGARVSLFGVTGKDAHAEELRTALSAHNVDISGLIADAGRPTTTKTRVIAAHQQVVRVDEEASHPISTDIADAVLQAVRQDLTNAGAIVISDYAKGFLTAPLLDAVIGEARRLGKRVFADPKGADAARYRGVFLLKPNRLELSLLTGLPPATTHEETLAAGSRLAASMPGTHILVTEGSEGMTLFTADQPPEHVTPTPRQVFDVTGAGDTVLAVIAMAVTAGASWNHAMLLAGEAAGIAIGQMGSVAVSLNELARTEPTKL
ncbi:MAG TPA: D-glycero-beta-D-manno-heptose-7-phosphate kinase [Bryobacteraceae bacterium]|nr:D-glycero-beta-D-manno-heptose-7-phosphate kinase [Bryobacteraceae bacterium]